jgi:hypothetical protein
MSILFFWRFVHVVPNHVMFRTGRLEHLWPHPCSLTSFTLSWTRCVEKEEFVIVGLYRTVLRFLISSKLLVHQICM